MINAGMFRSDEKVSVKISKIHIEEIQRQIDEGEAEFETVEEYIDFILTELLKREEDDQTYTPEEEEEVKNRLRALGYIE